MEQIEKNTVEAKNQLRPTEVVRFEHLENAGPRVLFAGNSITLHGIKPEIGWHWLWGMAASAKENDYVHRLMEKINALRPDAAYCIGQVSAWEVNYKNGESSYDRFKEASHFGADIIVMRFVENCPRDDFDQRLFEDELKRCWIFSMPLARQRSFSPPVFGSISPTPASAPWPGNGDILWWNWVTWGRWTR